MIDFKIGCKLAVNYFNKVEKKSKLARALDVVDAWIFFPNNDGFVEIGGVGIMIYKMDGKIEEFILPTPENLKLLDKAIPIEIPCEFL